MSEDLQPAPREARRGREARRTARQQRSALSIPYITRNIPITEVLSQQGSKIIEHNAETILQEIGIEFRDYPRALELLKAAGCDIKGERVRFPRGLARQLIATAPTDYVQHARNRRAQRPYRRQGHGLRAGLRLALRPRSRQGPPLRHDRGLPELREAGLHATPFMHHSGGTVCEPVDLPVNKRHLEMVYAHMRLFRQTVHGLRHASRPRAGHGAALPRSCSARISSSRTPSCTSLINANSPMVWDDTMLGAADVYAQNNQAVIITPFILSGAMSPVTVAGHAGAGAGRSARRRLLRAARAARCAGDLRHLRVDAIDAVGRADLRHAGGGARDLRRRPARAAHATCRSAPAARSAPPSCPTRRPLMRARRRSCPPSTRAPTSCCTRRAGWRAVSPRPTRSSSWTATSSA